MNGTTYNATKKKKDFFYVIILLLTLIVVVVGATMAAYYFLKQQKEGASNVYTGTLTISYLSGDLIKVDSLFPIYDADYDTKVNVYRNNFRVENTGTLDSVISVVMELNNNEFSDNVVKYKLFNDQKEVISSGNLDGTGIINIASNVVLESRKIVDYTLVIWIKETGVNQNEEMRKSLYGRIKVNANQMVD